ncbi:MAG TPA: DUF1080 domain-containing protein [Steroidobacteraceae bacterium]|nr:DUF1080 domain-containing protein [Steroidobacteraceae bacterium]
MSPLLLVLAIAVQAPQPDTRRPATGRWDLKLTATDGQTLPSWLEVRKSGNTALVGRYVAVVGSARPISKIDFTNDTMRFAIPPQWESGNGDLQVVAAVAGDNLSGSVTFPDGTTLPMTGVRAPALRPDAVRWGAPVRLFNGRDLSGWHPLPGGESAWQVVNGVLTNTKAGANLATDSTYGDFKLHVEFRYPPRGNSGVYLRGRHEVQIEDPVLGVVATEALGSIYGFLPPNENAGKNAGEWQTYDITLIGRQVTVVLNGREVISRRDIPGITGGALDSDEGAPGVIFLQGDHGPVEYRNIVITTTRSRPNSR